MISIWPCTMCKHRSWDRFPERFCAAFPDGIPEDIISEKSSHFDAFPGDHGIQFEEEEEDKLMKIYDRLERLGRFKGLHDK